MFVALCATVEYNRQTTGKCTAVTRVRNIVPCCTPRTIFGERHYAMAPPHAIAGREPFLCFFADALAHLTLLITAAISTPAANRCVAALVASYVVINVSLQGR